MSGLRGCNESHGPASCPEAESWENLPTKGLWGGVEAEGTSVEAGDLSSLPWLSRWDLSIPLAPLGAGGNPTLGCGHSRQFAAQTAGGSSQ